jgi:hypothetical protein
MPRFRMPRMSRTVIGAVMSMIILAAAAAPVAASTRLGDVTIGTSETVCQTYMNTVLGVSSLDQRITIAPPAVNSGTQMPSSRVRWTAYLQWSPITGTPTWHNWESKSVVGYVSGVTYAYSATLSGLSWQLNVPISSYRFRTYDKIEFLGASDQVISHTDWLLSDRYTTHVWITGKPLERDFANQWTSGACMF